jgi:hypothetical protein
LREHETPKLSAGERSLFAKHHQRQIFFQRETPLLIGFKGQPMPLLNFAQLEPEIRRRALAATITPRAGEQDTADIQK